MEKDEKFSGVEVEVFPRIICRKCKSDKEIYRVRETVDKRWKYMCKRCIDKIQWGKLVEKKKCR